MNPSISVIIPAYNRAALLPDTLRSLLAQTVPAAEIIVVDDGSTDGTADVAAAFGPPVRVIRQPNAGPGAARNTGFRDSRGEFIHFFDSDDIALPDKHEVQLRALLESGADIAYGPWVKGRFTGTGFVPEDLVLQQRGLPGGCLIKALLCHWSIVPHACLFRRAMVEKSGGFPEDLFVAEDQMMFLNCLLAGARVVHSPGTLELYRSDNPEKITGQADAGPRRVTDWARFLVMADRVCASHGIQPRRWSGFRRRAWEALRDLQAAGIVDDPLRESLAAIQGGRAFQQLHAIASWMGQKRGGLSHRLGLGRAHPCFKPGRPTPRQLGRMP